MGLSSKQNCITVGVFAALLILFSTTQSSQLPKSVRLLSKTLTQQTHTSACGSFGLQEGIAYLFTGGPAPIDVSTADVDDHEVFTISDICRLADPFGTPYVCPPSQPALHLLPSDSTVAVMVTPSKIAAGDSVTTVTVSITSNLIYGLTVELPIKIDICGHAPTIEDVSVTPSLPFGIVPRYRGSTYIDSTGTLILYFVGTFTPNRQQAEQSSVFTFATFKIQSIPAATCVPITYSLVETGPMTTSGPANIPLYVSSTTPPNIVYTPHRPLFSVAAPDTTCSCTPSCCVLPIRGNVNALGGITVADLTYLVQYLFNNGPAPPCPDEANVNGLGNITVADLTYLVQFLFNSGPQPAACP